MEKLVSRQAHNLKTFEGHCSGSSPLPVTRKEKEKMKRFVNIEVSEREEPKVSSYHSVS